MNMKLTAAMAIFILAAVLYTAAPVSGAVGTTPNITVVFDEPVIVSSIIYSLTDSIGNSYGLRLLEMSEDNTTFEYTTVERLAEGEHTVTFRAKDIHGTYGGEQSRAFTVVIPYLEANLAEPTFGVAGGSPYDVVIATNRPAECRWNWDRPRTYSEMEGDLRKHFATTDGITHNSEFSFRGEHYIACNDSYGVVWENLAMFNITLDTDPVAIVNQFADPDPVSDIPPETTLIVFTSEKARCRYSDDILVPYGSMNPFPGFGQDQFNYTHYQQISTSSETGTYTYYVQCEDKVPWISEKKAITFSVDLARKLRITSNMKPYYKTTVGIAINMSTNKDAVCFYTDNPSDVVKYNFGEGRYFTLPLPPLVVGEYGYWAYCYSSINESEDDTADLSFVIDLTPPAMIYVNDSNPDLPSNPQSTYRTDRLFARWLAEDNESPIDLYEYKIQRGPVLIAEGTTSAESETVTGLNLTNLAKYVFSVKARNSAGMWSDDRLSDGIMVDTSLTPQPCFNNQLDAGETDIDCGGDCPGCANGKKCRIRDDCSSGYCNKRDMCDMKPAPTCNDGILNQDETDADCGGNTCNPCDGGRLCIDDLDCLSGNCEYDVCSPADTCFSDIKDEGETDIDCGGVCMAGCGIDQNCEEDSDCISATKCRNSVCLLCADSDMDCDGIPNEEDGDIDDDGLKNWEDPDDDNDGICDTEESPLNDEGCAGDDTDDEGDGVPDPQDFDIDNDLDNDGTINERDDDMDGDGIANGDDPDDDNDGIPDDDDPDDDNDGIPDTEEDTDADRMPDVWEVDNELDKKDPGDAMADPDSDGLTNLEEYQSGYAIDPRNPDTDGDGWNDGKEIDAGTDPTDPESYPASMLPLVMAVVVLAALLGVGGYFGYQKYQDYTAAKPTAGMPYMPGGPARPPLRVMRGVAVQPPRRRKIVPGLAPSQQMALDQKRGVVERKRFAKAKKRGRLLAAFGAEKPAAKPSPEKKDAKPDLPEIKKGWIPVEKLRKQATPKLSSAFKRLTEISARKKAAGKPALKKPSVSSVFEKLGAMTDGQLKSKKDRDSFSRKISAATGAEVTEDIFQSLRDIASAKKVSKEKVSKALSLLSRKGSVSAKTHKDILSHMVSRKKLSREEAKEIFSKLGKLGRKSKNGSRK